MTKFFKNADDIQSWYVDPMKPLVGCDVLIGFYAVAVNAKDGAIHMWTDVLATPRRAKTLLETGCTIMRNGTRTEVRPFYTSRAAMRRDIERAAIIDAAVTAAKKREGR